MQAAMKATIKILVLLLAGVFFADPASAQAHKGRFGSSDGAGFTMKGTIYFLREGVDRLPDFRELKPVGVIFTKELDIPKRRFEEGFPGVTDRIEWFAIDYKGQFYLENEGRYSFRLTSDDGAQLYIDEKLVIDNDGLHEAQAKEVSIPLSEGIHNVQVKYFQGPAYEVALRLEIARGDGEYRLFNTDRLGPPAGTK